MQSSDPARKELVLRLLAQNEDVAYASSHLWERLAIELVGIVGESGFNLLFARSIHSCRAEFPWLAVSQPWRQPDSRFTALEDSLHGKAPDSARLASAALFLTFTDVLASLIGEPLTIRILHSAWDEPVPGNAGKEFPQ